MKAALTLGLALLTAVSAQADVFGPRGVRSGGGRSWVNHGRGPDRGHDRGHVHYRSHVYPRHYSGYIGYRRPWFSYYPGYDVRYYPYANFGYYGAGYGYYGQTYYDNSYYGGVTYSQPAYYGSNNGVATGMALGAIAGGIIGHNSGDLRHNGWRGAGIGAVIGGLIGSVADANRRIVTHGTPQYQTVPQYQVVPQYQTVPAATYSAPAQTQQPVTIINNYYNSSATPMSAANGLFGR